MIWPKINIPQKDLISIRKPDIDVKVLETIPFEYPGSDTEVVYETEEFTCACPWTGLSRISVSSRLLISLINR